MPTEMDRPTRATLRAQAHGYSFAGLMMVARADVLALLDALDQADALVLERDRLQEVLRGVRRVQHHDDRTTWTECPECGAEDLHPCRPDCALDAALRATGGGRA